MKPVAPAERLLRVVPWALLALGILIFYLVEASRRPTPRVFTDELEWTQISRAIAATGHAARRGQPVFFKSLYAYLIAPAWWIHSTAAAYAAIKYLNAIVMCLAAIPTYLLARMLLVRRTAIVVSLLAIAIPAMSYATSIIPEPLAYLWFTTTAWLTVRALASPGRGSAPPRSSLPPRRPRSCGKEFVVLPAAGLLAAAALVGRRPAAVVASGASGSPRARRPRALRLPLQPARGRATPELGAGAVPEPPHPRRGRARLRRARDRARTAAPDRRDRLAQPRRAALRARLPRLRRLPRRLDPHARRLHRRQGDLHRRELAARGGAKCVLPLAAPALRHRARARRAPARLAARRGGDGARADPAIWSARFEVGAPYFEAPGLAILTLVNREFRLDVCDAASCCCGRRRRRGPARPAAPRRSVAVVAASCSPAPGSSPARSTRR